jgi:hypothetical protein
MCHARGLSIRRADQQTPGRVCGGLSHGREQRGNGRLHRRPSRVSRMCEPAAGVVWGRGGRAGHGSGKCAWDPGLCPRARCVFPLQRGVPRSRRGLDAFAKSPARRARARSLGGADPQRLLAEASEPAKEIRSRSAVYARLGVLVGPLRLPVEPRPVSRARVRRRPLRRRIDRMRAGARGRRPRSLPRRAPVPSGSLTSLAKRR